MDASHKLIIALDVPDFGQMKSIVERIGPAISTYKIGHQLFTAEGPQVIHYLKEQGKSVFLDLKLHEIPNSVALAIEAAGRHGVDMVTVHATGGGKMMQAAVEASSEFPAMKILALTVVTGLSDRDLEQIGYIPSCEELVLRLAKLAQESGCHGVVASPKEIALIRSNLGDELLIVTPGVRPADSDAGDQSRIGTPEQAINSGASYIVLGRPVVKAESPALAVKNIIHQIHQIETSSTN